MQSHRTVEIEIPVSIDAPNAGDFIAATGVRNAVEAAAYGTDELGFGPAELLPGWLDQEHTPMRMFAVRSGETIVARGTLETAPDPADTTAWVSVDVLPSARRRGIGTALLRRVEAEAATSGATRLIAYVPSADAPGPRIPSPTGFGSVPRDNDEVRFLLANGYGLEQVVRGSRLALPIADDELAARLDEARARSGADYRVHTWIDRTPPEWLDDVAVLLTRMSLDEPQGELGEPEDVWTAERLAGEEERQAASPRTNLVVAVEHVPTATIVGYSDLGVPVEHTRPAGQRDTIVLPEHRGHRLGMLLKLANIAHLQRERPGHPAITTFNAEENRHMLSVNEAVGFAPIGYEGAWKKLL